jgi:Zn-dependent protease/CBS domain-containing protein
MRGGLRLGRLFGIDVTIDWSWTLVFVLITWNLTVVFRTWHPSWPPVGGFFLAVAAAVIFFGSVLAHELAHALVATSYGMSVREIRLFLFGGVSNIEREPPSPKAEFWIAIAGPLLSLGLGLAFITGAGLMLPSGRATTWEALAGLGPLATLLFWLGPINVMLGAFNLIPGFPLDGGRVLRAAIWKVTGDGHKATFAASTAGRVIGWMFVFMGVAMIFGAKIPFFGRGAGSGIWLAFIGWFLTSAAEQSYGAMVVQETLQGVHVSDLMRRAGRVVPVETSVRAVVDDWFLRSNEHAFPVVRNGRLLGVISVGDVRKIARETWDATAVTSIMTPRERLAVVSATDGAESALRTLAERDVDQLPVLEGDGDLLVGMISRSDLARWLELHSGGPGRLGLPRHA